MAKIKVDEGEVGVLQGAADLSSSSAQSLNGPIEQLKSEAYEDLDTKLEQFKKVNTKPPQGENQSDEDYADDVSAWEAEIKAAEGKVSTAKQNIDKHYASAISAVGKIIKKMGDVSAALSAVLTAVNNFNGNVDIAKAFESLGITVSMEENVNGGETPIIYYTVGDQKYTLSELLNAFYTYTGMSMSTVVQGALLAEELGISPEDYAGEKGDAIRQAMLDQVNALTSFAAKTRAFGLATEEDQNNMAKSLGIDLSQYTSASSLIGDDETKDKYSGALSKALEGINGLTTDNAKVFGGALGAFGLASFLNANHDPSNPGKKSDDDKKTDDDDKKTDDETPPDDGNGNGDDNSRRRTGGSDDGGGSSGGSGGSHGGSGGSSGKSSNGKTTDPVNPKETDPEDPTVTPTNPKEDKEKEKTTGTPTEPTIPGTVVPTEGNTEPLETPEDASELPTETLPTEIQDLEKDYDDLARQQFEAQGEEAISEHRAEVIEEANRLFEAEDKTPLREKLKAYGYEDADIEAIIQDRDLTISALVSGDQREQLAKIANELAEKDGVKEFDTVYDNAQTATSLTDGTTTKLLANMSGDEGIKNAYTALAASEKTYTEANTAAISAMAAVTLAQTKLTEITNKIGTNIKENPSQWDTKTMTAYNEEVTKLHTETVNSIGGNINNWSNDDIKKYQAAESEATTKVAYARGTDLSTWSTEQKSKYEKNLLSLREKYNKAYGKDTSKWSSEVKKSYETAKNNTYKQMAVEVGKGKLTAEDKKKIASMTQETKNELIAKNGDMKNWTKEQKAEYEEKVAEIKKKYADQTSTATGEAIWTKADAAEYNKAIKEYNEAVKNAKEAMTKLDEAKAGYAEAKTGVQTAKDEFYKKLLADQAQEVVDPSAVEIVDPSSQQSNSGNPVISGIEISENGATITNTGNAQVGKDGVVTPEAVPTEAETPVDIPPEEIVNDDEAEQTSNGGIPIIDVGQATSGTISNEDIPI